MRSYEAPWRLDSRVCGLLALALLVLTFAAAAGVHAQTYSVLYTFTGGMDGANPFAGLMRDKAGNLYGTTLLGGASNAGTVFKLDGTGTETVLYTFTAGTDGALPYASLVMDKAGNLYGTTAGYGAYGYGTVFKLDTTGKETTLHGFAGGTDGGLPFAGLVRDKQGNLYGTAVTGGDLSCNTGLIKGCGVVFKIDTTGTYSVLYAFAGGTDGANPYGRLTMDAQRNLYGTTFSGGASNAGTVFKLGTTGTKSVLYSFSGGMDGANPFAGLIRNRQGNLYGTTQYGGDLTCNAPYGCGTVFKLNTKGRETVLHRFAGGAHDGATPYASLVMDKAGNLYGTTIFGGASNAGTVFELDRTGTETLSYTFTGGADGATPYASLVMDKAGNLYGTTELGGDLSCGGTISSCGVVFVLVPRRSRAPY